MQNIFLMRLILLWVSVSIWSQRIILRKLDFYLICPKKCILIVWSCAEYFIRINGGKGFGPVLVLWANHSNSLMNLIWNNRYLHRKVLNINEGPKVIYRHLGLMMTGETLNLFLLVWLFFPVYLLQDSKEIRYKYFILKLQPSDI